jgi:hypothetical protein
VSAHTGPRAIRVRVVDQMFPNRLRNPASLVTSHHGPALRRRRRSGNDEFRAPLTEYRSDKDARVRGLIRWSMSRRRPELHIVVTTARCNLACTYCHMNPQPAESSRDEFDMSLETARAVVEFAMSSPNSRISFEFQGGEPFQISEIFMDAPLLYERLERTGHILTPANAGRVPFNSHRAPF